jgi:hypothetical protein
MQLNYPAAIHANRAVVLPARPIAVPASRRTAHVRKARFARCGINRKKADEQLLETIAWLTLALSSLAALELCLNI